MSEIKLGVPEERVAEGQEIYVESMEKSSIQKFQEVRPHVRPGIIYDMGAGGGALTSLLGNDKSLSGSKFVAIDNSEEMVERMKRRFHGQDNVRVELADSVGYEFKEKAHTILRVSHNHEIFNYYGYKHEPVVKAMQNDFAGMNEGGREIIRDGVMPAPGTLYISPISDFAAERFSLFVDGFSMVRDVAFEVGKINADKLKWEKTGDKAKVGSIIRMRSEDSYELLNKFFYSQINLPVELTEQFGIWTLPQYENELRNVGFKVVLAKTFLLEYLLKTQFSPNFEIYKEENGILTHAPYPDSTMLLVGEKP
jgi:SAM-dependent methyltransferase